MKHYMPFKRYAINHFAMVLILQLMSYLINTHVYTSCHRR